MPIESVAEQIYILKEKGLKAIGYCRESSKNKDYLIPLGNHVADLKLCHCDRIVAEIESAFRDVERPLFNRVMQWLREGRYQILVVPTMARFGRRLDANLALIKELNKIGIHLYTIDEGYLSGDTTETFNAIATSSHQAEMESRRISDRVLKGKRGVFRRNEPAAALPPLGYKRGLVKGKKRFVIDPEKIEKAEFIIDCFIKEKGSHTAVNRRLHKKYGVSLSKTSFKNWIRNPTLRGHTHYKKEGVLVKDTHEPILKGKKLDQVDQIIQDRQWFRGKAIKGTYRPYAGLIFCASCKECLRWHSSHNNTYRYYKHRLRKPGEKKCSDTKMIKEDDVRKGSIEALKSHAEAIVKSMSKSKSEFVPSRKLIKKEKQLDALRSTYESGGFKELKEAIEALEVEISTIYQNERQSLIISADRQVMLRALSTNEFWEEATDPELRIVYQNLIQKILIKDGQIHRVDFLI